MFCRVGLYMQHTRECQRFRTAGRVVICGAFSMQVYLTPAATKVCIDVYPHKLYALYRLEHLRVRCTWVSVGRVDSSAYFDILWYLVVSFGCKGFELMCATAASVRRKSSHNHSDKRV